jgi:penicillin-insensitive murein endopeptidase
VPLESARSLRFSPVRLSLLRPLALLAASALTLGCFGSPTPLAPSVRGSVGVPHRGTLTDAVPLAKKGPGYRRLRGDAIRWGHPRLVAAIERAAAEVERQRPGTPVMVADLSAKHGGETPGHNSHRTGRDADLLFYALTPAGLPVRSPGFARFGPDGLARVGDKYLRFDVERTWLLVRALVSDPEAELQWLFIAHWLEALLIEYARARGEPDDVVARAQAVLHQPGDSLPHDDHLHLRVACSPDDAVAGCLGGGPRWSWLTPLPSLGAPADNELLHAILDEVVVPPRAAAAAAARQSRP